MGQDESDLLGGQDKRNKSKMVRASEEKNPKWKSVDMGGSRRGKGIGKGNKTTYDSPPAYLEDGGQELKVSRKPSVN